MNQKIASYSKRLSTFYTKWGDVKSAEQIDDLLRQAENIKEISSLRENPHAKKVIEFAISRWRACAQKLITDEKMTIENRMIMFVDMDWAKWYITVMGGDIVKAEREIEKSLEKGIAEMDEYEKSHGTQ